MTTTLSGVLSGAARWFIPRPLRRRIATAVQRATRWPPVGSIALGDLRRTSPISDDWGFDRGTPVDRYFIHRFLETNAPYVRGETLEIDTDEYTRRYGGDRVKKRDVLHLTDYLPGITIVGDLTDGRTIPSDAFDCVIVTQTLQLIYDPAAAVRTLHRILKPGGVVLSTVPGISKMTVDEDEKWGYFWGFTSLSARRIFQASFGDGQVDITTYGNVLSASAFLYGLAAEELSADELNRTDPDVQLLIGIRATKAPHR
jgi:SAM-dependent methyltransferase